MIRNKFFLLIFTCLATILSAQGPAQNWYHLDKSDGYNGISTYRAYKELIKNNPGKTVIVAVIDSGIDAEHEDLKDNMWVNPGEIPGNGVDDDSNGYIDDINGWNFIGGKNGQNVGPDSYEATRVYASMRYKYESADPNKLTKEQQKEYKLFVEVKTKVEAERKSAEAAIGRLDAAEEKIMAGFATIESIMTAKNLSYDSLQTLDLSNDQDAAIALKVITQMREQNPEINSVSGAKKLFKDAITEDKQPYINKLEISYNPEFDSRKTIVKDDYANSNERNYGNNDVEGTDALHGTHVAGIIGAVSDNKLGNDGVARNVKLMSVRAVPDGDERDKDVANAIRYAVDNGAQVINMSFGKGYSWDKKVVDEAVKYAAKHDVLLVHAAGNSAMDNDTSDNFPNDDLGKSGFLCKKTKNAKNWIEVGALSYKKEEDMVAGFSNYGKKNVDIFSPGVQIFNTLPDNKYANLQGTSMASPVVAGVAAVLRSQFPSLTAEQVKDIILKSSVKSVQIVKKPGTKGAEKVGFNTLSTTGGEVNLFEAVKLAGSVKGKKKLPKTSNA